jgi:hypothetical protein
MTLLFSCRETPQPKPAPALRDTVVKSYFQSVEGAGGVDTGMMNYLLLKAYVNNDTAVLRKAAEEIKKWDANRKQWESMYNCIGQPKLQDLGADEVYRFIYSQAFCQSGLSITITRKGDSIRLNTIWYIYHWDSSACRLLQESNKTLTTTQWSDLTSALHHADLWALNEENDLHGLDGDDLTVMGYVNDKESKRPRYTRVHRWRPSVSPLGDPFILVRKLAGAKTCY